MASLFNRTNWGRIRLTGADRVRFLHNQTTNSIEQLRAGQGCHTVFVTSTGRTIDLASAYAFEDSLLVVVSPGVAKTIYEWMDRYIFFSDKVTLSDESEQTFMFTLIGDNADKILRQIATFKPFEKAAPNTLQNTHAHQTISLPQTTAPITIAANTDLALNGYTIWGDSSDADAVESKLLAAGAIAKSSADWETLRIQQGRPMPNAELTDDDNPLESGLWKAISFEKGCYIGQETIARLNTYKGVKKRLWGIQLQAPLASDTDLANWVITVDGNKVGKMTSLDTAGDFALGYIRTKAGGEGLSVSIENAQESTTTQTIQGKTASLPFIHHHYYTAPDKA